MQGANRCASARLPQTHRHISLADIYLGQVVVLGAFLRFRCQFEIWLVLPGCVAIGSVLFYGRKGATSSVIISYALGTCMPFR